MKAIFKNKKLKVFICTVLVIYFACVAVALGINFYIKTTQKSRIITAEKAAELQDVDCIIVLGCKVNDDGTPSDMLRDRLTRGIELYGASAAPKIIMSGDHGRENYDEVNVMKHYAMEYGIPSENIFMDHAGFSTYESIYRARDIFCAKKIIVVSQNYHLYRALYIAEKLGIEAYGVDSDYHIYRGAWINECREILARNKDFFKVIVKPEPTFLGEKIPVSGDGNLTAG
ncbi:MAG: YdcF family protein [Clostridia bacterium]|nr:YdcF family protein [Clostridia bacterium]